MNIKEEEKRDRFIRDLRVSCITAILILSFWRRSGPDYVTWIELGAVLVLLGTLFFRRLALKSKV